jgi:hypothetical protein
MSFNYSNHIVLSVQNVFLQRPNELLALLLIFGLMSIFYPELLEVVVSLGVLLVWSILYVKADNIHLFDLIIIIDQKPF